MATIPSGGYPKAPFVSDGRRTVNLVYLAGDVKQYTPVVFNNAAEEAAYTGNGVAITSTHGTGTPDSWSSGWKNSGGSGSGGSSNK